jgi:hypothetical protein
VDGEEDPLHIKRDLNITHKVTINLKSQIQSIQYGKQLLSKSKRAYFEPRFGVDFSLVRLHSYAQAAESFRASIFLSRMEGV